MRKDKRNEDFEENTPKRAEHKKGDARNRSREDMGKLTKAKEIIMAKFDMTEPEAHKYLQKRAMDAGTDLIEATEMIILMYG